MPRVIVLAAVLVAGALASPEAQRLAASHGPAVAPAVLRAAEVARVNGVILLSDRLDNAVNALVPMESFHQNLSPAKLAEIRGRALQQIIDDELIYQAGTARGVSVTDAAVDAAFARTVTQYGGNAGFKAALRQYGASVASVRRELRRALVISSTRERMVTARCQVTEAEAGRFFREHPERFVEPERVRVEAITIGVEPSSTGAQWAEARKKAAEVGAQLKGGAAFGEMARRVSTDPSRAKGGDMGWFHRGSLTPAFEEAAKALSPGEVSPVIESLYGYHLIRIVDVRPPRRASYASVARSLRKDLTDGRCREAGDAWLKTLRGAARIVVAQS